MAKKKKKNNVLYAILSIAAIVLLFYAMSFLEKKEVKMTDANLTEINMSSGETMLSFMLVNKFSQDKDCILMMNNGENTTAYDIRIKAREKLSKNITFIVGTGSTNTTFGLNCS